MSMIPAEWIRNELKEVCLLEMKEPAKASRRIDNIIRELRGVKRTLKYWQNELANAKYLAEKTA